MSAPALPPLAARHVGELVAELDPLVAGAFVKDIACLPPRDVMLVIEPVGADFVLRLRLAGHPDAPRLHMQRGRQKRHDGPLGPFFELLAKELTGATIRGLEQVRQDRMVLLELHKTPSGERRALLLELFGRHANLVLLGRDDVVLASCVPGKGKNAERIRPGHAWEPPGGAGPRGSEPAPLCEHLPDPPPPPGHSPERAPLSWRVEAALGEQAEAAVRDDERRRLLQRAKRKLGRAKGLVKGLEQRTEASSNAVRVQQDGELLKAALGQLKRGMESVELVDWFDESKPRRIALDPRRSPQENVTRVFDRYKKLVRGAQTVAEELDRARSKVHDLEALIENASSAEDPIALDASAVERGLLDKPQVADPRRKKPPAKRLPYRLFEARDGSEIRVGKNARDNDELTLRHARGNDYWLHTADCPGSHVILRVERGHEPSDEALLDAAFLAIHFSPAGKSGRAPVHIARRKYVHKPKGAKAGLVTLSGGKTMEVSVQQARLESLLRSARGRDAPHEGS